MLSASGNLGSTPSMRRPVRVKSVFLFPPYKGLLRSSRAASVAILPSALFFEGSKVQILTLLQDRLSRIPADGLARGAAQVNQFMPAGRFGMFAGGVRRFRMDRRVNRDGDTGLPWLVSAVALKTAIACHVPHKNLHPGI